MRPELPHRQRKSFSFQFRRISLNMKERIFIIFIVRNSVGGIIKLKYPWDSAKLSLHLSRISCEGSRGRQKIVIFFNYILFRLWLFFVIAEAGRAQPARACRNQFGFRIGDLASSSLSTLNINRENDGEQSSSSRLGCVRPDLGCMLVIFSS